MELMQRRTVADERGNGSDARIARSELDFGISIKIFIFKFEGANFLKKKILDFC